MKYYYNTFKEFKTRGSRQLIKGLFLGYQISGLPISKLGCLSFCSCRCKKGKKKRLNWNPKFYKSLIYEFHENVFSMTKKYSIVK